MTTTRIKNAIGNIITKAIDFQYAQSGSTKTSFNSKDIALYKQKEESFFAAVTEYQAAVAEFTAALLLDKISIIDHKESA